MLDEAAVILDLYSEEHLRTVRRILSADNFDHRAILDVSEDARITEINDAYWRAGEDLNELAPDESTHPQAGLAEESMLPLHVLTS